MEDTILADTILAEDKENTGLPEVPNPDGLSRARVMPLEQATPPRPRSLRAVKRPRGDRVSVKDIIQFCFPYGPPARPIRAALLQWKPL